MGSVGDDAWREAKRCPRKSGAPRKWPTWRLDNRPVGEIPAHDVLERLRLIENATKLNTAHEVPALAGKLPRG